MKYCDIRHMRNPEAIEGALEVLSKLTPVVYEHNTGFGFAPKTPAVPAQEMAAIPGAMEKDGIGNCTADSDALVPYLVAAINELRAEVAALKAPRRRQSAA